MVKFADHAKQLKKGKDASEELDKEEPEDDPESTDPDDPLFQKIAWKALAKAQWPEHLESCPFWHFIDKIAKGSTKVDKIVDTLTE